jgi:hypothetical protein
MEAQDLRLETLKQQIRIGIEDLNAGRSVVLDEETLQAIKQRGRQKLAQSGSIPHPVTTKYGASSEDANRRQ